MAERRCRYCEQVFEPSKYQPGQTVCTGGDCQRRRRADYHRQKIAADPEYRQVCLDSPQKWRSGHPDYWRQYREQHPAAVERNRRQQQIRDRGRRLRKLANNNSVFQLNPSTTEVWFAGPGFARLANNNSVPAQVWILEGLPPRKPPVSESCKQQPSGLEPALAG
jgi:hypothetical protein